MGKLSSGKQRLLDYLEKPYTVKKIDFENCIYLDGGDFDIEISGGRTVHSKIDVYVWSKRKSLQITERHLGVKYDLAGVKALLDDIKLNSKRLRE